MRFPVLFIEVKSDKDDDGGWDEEGVEDGDDGVSDRDGW